MRRSREFVRQNYKEVEIDRRIMRFPRRELHKIGYNLQQTYEGLYEQAAYVIEHLVLAPYRIQFYQNDVPKQYRLFTEENLDFKNVSHEIALQLGRQFSVASLLRLLYRKGSNHL